MMGDIKKTVIKLVNKYHSKDLYELASFLDINIISMDLGSSLGMYRYVKRNKFIFLNNSLDEITKRFVLAHELGHAVLHTKTNCFYLKHNTFSKVSTFEIEANVFAAELLIDDEELQSCIKNGFTKEQMASYFKVTIELINYKSK